MRIFTSLLLVGILAAINILTAEAQKLSSPDNPQDIGEIIMVAGDVIDLRWDPALYPSLGTGEQFVRYELSRSIAGNPYEVITTDSNSTDRSWRDEDLGLNISHSYKLNVIHCKPCSPTPTYHTHLMFTSLATTGQVWGSVTRNLKMSTGSFTMVGDLVVQPGFRLTIDDGTTLSVVNLNSRAIRSRGGKLEIDGGKFYEGVNIFLGESSPAVQGQGWVKNAEFPPRQYSSATVFIEGLKNSYEILNNVGVGVVISGESSLLFKNNERANLYAGGNSWVYAEENSAEEVVFSSYAKGVVTNNEKAVITVTGMSQVKIEKNALVTATLNSNAVVDIRHNPNIGSISMKDNAWATIYNNTIKGMIIIEDNAGAEIEHNTLGAGLRVFGQGTWAEIVDNTLLSETISEGIEAWYGADVLIAWNRLNQSYYMGSWSPTLVDVWGDGTVGTVKNNQIVGGRIELTRGAAVTVTHNVLSGDKAQIVVGCFLCDGDTTGKIEGNTVQNGRGFQMWGGSHQLAVQNNCIRGNNPGLKTYDTYLTKPVNMINNYWGHISGPTHPANPGGVGDRIDGNMVSFLPYDQTGASCTDTPPPPDPDLRIIGFEAIQVTQNLENMVPLVANKPTLLRFYPESRFTNIGGAAYRLTATRSGAQLGVINGAFSASPLPDLDKLRATKGMGIDIKIPDAWCSGNVDLLLELNPEKTIKEFDYKNNTFPYTLVFQARRALNIGLLPIAYKPDPSQPATSPERDDLPGMIYPFRAMYPIHSATPLFLWPGIPWEIKMGGTPMPTQEANGNKLLEKLNKFLLKWNEKPPKGARLDQIHGVFPGVGKTSIDFCSSDPRWSKDRNPEGGLGVSSYCFSNGAIMSHEIGHNLGLRHPGTPDACDALDDESYWKQVYTDAKIQDYGYNSLNDKIVPRSTIELMTWCPEPLWISGLNYSLLFLANGYPQDAVQAPEIETTYLVVGGSLTPADVATFDPFMQISSDTPPINPQVGTQYCLELRNAANTILQKRCFNLGFFNYETQTSASETSFMVSLPLTVGATKAVLVKNGVELGQVQATSHAPSVTLTYPNGGESLIDSVNVQWNAQDLDGGSLYFNLSYSADNGVTWYPLAVDLNGVSSYMVDLSLLPGCQQCRIQINASDGFNSTSDISNQAFSVSDHSPMVQITNPVDGSTTVFPAEISGIAFDPEDGELSGTALTWSSNRDGSLGSGNTIRVDLSAGQHTLTLTAKDSLNHSSSKSVTVNVIQYLEVYLPLIRR